jgi:hypothetical protein
MSNLDPRHKANDPKCSCVDGQYKCWHCRNLILDAIIARQTPAQREYDRLAMSGWRPDDDHDYESGGCSCHLRAPCSFCMSKDDEE